ncbi:MAG: secondary thiamine-phosphate synthase enzyme YjbQ [Chitinophagales bacterium]|nr:secondary thiamine-phosphate synthase enzyme YjbQ [Bacteroidota bacterium]
MITQYEIILPEFPRGFHLITQRVLAQIKGLPQTGIFHLFIKHTSAGLTINENADDDVRRDFASWMDRYVKENEPYYLHTIEGSDDMPAHIKSSLVGSSISIPITNGKLNLGTWQGIYLCEFRNRGGQRKLIATIYGE